MGFIAYFVPIMILISVIAFIFEFMDASLGMGFGTTLTPVLLIIGFPSNIIVPAVLISELCAGFVAVISHSLLKNIKFGQKKIFKKRRRLRRKSHPYALPGTVQATPIAISKHKQEPASEYLEDHHFEYSEEEIIIEDESEIDFHEDDELVEIKIENGSLKDKIKNLTTDTKVVIILGTFGILGATVAAILSVLLQPIASFVLAVKIYIGVMVFFMGVIILTLRNKKIKLSMKRIVALGAVAGFNKGISGGGYGPITVSGQLLAGREGRNAIASTTFSETATCFVGASAYILTNIFNSYLEGGPISIGDLSLAPYLIVGAILAAPCAALVTKKVESKWLKIAVGGATIFLGLFSLTRLALSETGVWDSIPNFIEEYLFPSTF
ncbi:MAG: sulfite exporter TauE/SafE family protein [Candidatus Heimdallarchaeota archaeon]|nr:sulfite exporter TauE/SafE family protein [Candidatus Heimdallarchaeota archaeon]